MVPLPATGVVSLVLLLIPGPTIVAADGSPQAIAEGSELPPKWVLGDYWMFQWANSPDHFVKWEIVRELSHQGVDYFQMHVHSVPQPSGGGIDSLLVYRKSDLGVSENFFDSPARTTAWPIEVGNEWVYVDGFGNHSCRVASRETIIVGGGAFKAYRITSTGMAGFSSGNATSWFSMKVGFFVKNPVLGFLGAWYEMVLSEYRYEAGEFVEDEAEAELQIARVSNQQSQVRIAAVILTIMAVSAGSFLMIRRRINRRKLFYQAPGAPGASRRHQGG